MTKLFHSRLAGDLGNYLGFKRALGCAYVQSLRALRSFDRYVALHGPSRGTLPIEDLLRDWLGRIPERKPITMSVDLGIIRQFLRFRRRSDPAGFVPGRHWGPGPVTSQFVPHVLSIQQVKATLRSARHLSSPSFRAKTFRMIILLLYCTGLRPGEAARLKEEDVDLRRRVLFVRESKGKSRWVPFRSDLAREIERYRRARGRVRASGTNFLRHLDGHALSNAVIWQGMNDIFHRAGLKQRGGRDGPRPFDFRHTFAVHRLTRWYRAGADLHARLPWLSAYMGHDNLLGTETYLTATPELLALASRRFAARFQASRAPRGASRH